MDSMDHQDKKEISELAQEAYNKDAGVWREYRVSSGRRRGSIPDNHHGEINDWGDVIFLNFGVGGHLTIMILTAGNLKHM